MVVRIDKPDKDTLISFDEVFKERTRFKRFYRAIKKDWRLQVQSYITEEGSPENIDGLNLKKYLDNPKEVEAREKSLIGLYSAKKDKKPYEDIKRIRSEHKLLVCPSCGQVTIPNTVDHYLPKSHFPELAIVLVNLTPMCSQCQDEKGNEYLNEFGQKKFIHPYYDDVNIPLFSFKFHPPYNSAKFEVKVETLDNNLKRLVIDHMKGLGLEHRLPSFLKTKYLHLLKTAKKYRDRGKENRLIEVFDDRKDDAEDKAFNSWEAVFYRSVLLDDELQSYLIEGELPEKL